MRSLMGMIDGVLGRIEEDVVFDFELPSGASSLRIRRGRGYGWGFINGIDAVLAKAAATRPYALDWCGGDGCTL